MLTTHILAVLFSVVVVLLADKEALSWMRGKKLRLSARRLQVFHLLTWAGLATLTVSGAFLAYPALSYLLGQPLFIMKMLFVAVLFVNAVLIGKLSPAATQYTYAGLPSRERLKFLTSGMVSSFSWAAAAVLALIVFK